MRRSMHHTSTPLGYIMLYIDESQLSRYIFTDVSFGEGSNFLLIDAAGNVVSSQNAELLGEDLADDPIFQQITAHRQAGENNFLCELNGVDKVRFSSISFLKIVLHSFAQNNDLVRIFRSIFFALVDKLRTKS